MTTVDEGGLVAAKGEASAREEARQLLAMVICEWGCFVQADAQARALNIAERVILSAEARVIERAAARALDVAKSLRTQSKGYPNSRADALEAFSRALKPE